MQRFKAPTLFIILWALVHITSALTPFAEGAYEFETCGSNCTLSGTWLSLNNGAQEFAYATGASDYVEFQAIGKQLIVYRVAGAGFASMQVCINATCPTVSNSNSVLLYNLAYVANLTGGTDTIRITGNFVYLDQFVIIGDIPDPTATAIATSTPAPTSTPAYTATPQPTWTLAPSITPQPTATPMVGGGGGSDPASVYATVESGQIIRFDYIATAGNVHIANLLAALFFSAWAMFFVGIFIVWQGNNK